MNGVELIDLIQNITTISHSNIASRFRFAACCARHRTCICIGGSSVHAAAILNTIEIS